MNAAARISAASSPAGAAEEKTPRRDESSAVRRTTAAKMAIGPNSYKARHHGSRTANSSLVRTKLASSSRRYGVLIWLR